MKLILKWFSPPLLMPLLLLLLALLKPQLSAAYPPTGSIVIALLRKTEAPFRRSTAVHRAPLLTACTELQQMSAGCSRSYLRHQNSSSQPPQPQPHQESNSLTRSHHQLRSKSSRSAGAFLYGEIHIFFKSTEFHGTSIVNCTYETPSKNSWVLVDFHGVSDGQFTVEFPLNPMMFYRNETVWVAVAVLLTRTYSSTETE